MTICNVFRCSRQDQLYLYVRDDLDLAKLPEALLKRTGTLSPVMTLDLASSRKLARVDKVKVIAALSSKGFYLQLPPDGLMNAHLQDGD